MNGAESLVHTLLKSGVDTCFCNPGTSEMHFVAALDRVPGMRCVLGLFEGVVTGAADGYARMSGKPAATLLHCGPGLANGLANLHNARRAQTPHRQHRRRPGHLPSPERCPADRRYRRLGARRLRLGAHRHLVGHRWRRCGRRGAGRPHPSGPDRHADPALRHLLGRRRHRRRRSAGAAQARRPTPPRSATRRRSCAAASPTLIVLGGEAVRAEALEHAHRIATATGAKLIAQGANARVSRGRGRVPIDRIPYVVDMAVKALAGTRHVILCGLRKPVTFFAYPNKPTTPIPPDANIHILARPDQDAAEALARLADELNAPRAPIPDPGPRAEPARGKLTPGIRRRHPGRAAAGPGRRHRRGGHLRPRLLPVHLRRRPA